MCHNVGDKQGEPCRKAIYSHVTTVFLSAVNSGRSPPQRCQTATQHHASLTHAVKCQHTMQVHGTTHCSTAEQEDMYAAVMQHQA